VNIPRHEIQIESFGETGSRVLCCASTIDIGRLRKLLNPGREQDPIRTVRGAGYALDDRFAKAEPQA